MTRVLLWKEYREQRGLWLGLAGLAIVFCLGVGSVLPPGGLAMLSHDDFTRTLLLVLLVNFVIGYPLVCGALLLAGERDGGTEDWLRYQAGTSVGVWRSKLSAGLLLCLALAIGLAGLGIALNLTADPATRWSLLAYFMLLSADALVWGFLASALCPKVLWAVFLAIALWALSWIVAIALSWLVGLSGWFVGDVILPKTALAGLALFWSHRRYGRDDRLRHVAEPAKPRALKSRGTLPMLFWLTTRQARIEIALLGMLAVGGGILVANHPVYAWPALTLIMGWICGFAAFGHERARGEESFLGALRTPPTRTWLGKVALWLVMLAAACALLNLLAFMIQDTRGLQDSLSERHIFYPFESLALFHYQRRGTFLPVMLALWPIYGFSFGLVFGKLLRRTIMAAICGVLSCTLVLALWLPSLVIGGVRLWQLFLLPAWLLIGSRLMMWPWLAGRLGSGKNLLALIGGGGVAAAFVAGAIAYRAVEVPNVVAPFDLAQIRAELDELAHNPSAALLRQAAHECYQQQKHMDNYVDMPNKWKARREENDNLRLLPLTEPFSEVVWLVSAGGWPKQEENFGKWLDAHFAHHWVKNLDEALRLPEGVVENPRHSSPGSTWDNYRIAFDRMGRALLARAEQMRNLGKEPEAASLIEKAFAVSRRLSHYAPPEVSAWAVNLEQWAGHTIERWLFKEQLSVEQLQGLLKIVRDHEAKRRTVTDYRRAAFAYLTREPTELIAHRTKCLQQSLLNVALRLPWERERLRRFVNLHIQHPVFADSESAPGWLSLQHDLGTRDTLTFGGAYYHGAHQLLEGLQRLRVLELQIALTLYQRENGKQATQLDDLVPRYLPQAPIDPFTGKAFHYRISQGETLPHLGELKAGQGVIETPANDSGHVWRFLVPRGKVHKSVK